MPENVAKLGKLTNAILLRETCQELGERSGNCLNYSDKATRIVQLFRVYQIANHVCPLSHPASIGCVFDIDSNAENPVKLFKEFRSEITILCEHVKKVSPASWTCRLSESLFTKSEKDCVGD